MVAIIECGDEGEIRTRGSTSLSPASVILFVPNANVRFRPSAVVHHWQIPSHSVSVRFTVTGRLSKLVELCWQQVRGEQMQAVSGRFWSCLLGFRRDPAPVICCFKGPLGLPHRF